MIECARYTLSKFDIHETDESNLRRLIGPPLEHAFRDYYGFDEIQADQAVIYFRDMMQREGILLYEAYPGIPELLKDLKQAGKTLAVVTSKIEHIARDTLTKAVDDLGVTDTSTVVMIGDRKHDVEAANTHDIDSIGVLWGYGDKEELQNEGATHIVSNANELEQLLINE